MHILWRDESPWSKLTRRHCTRELHFIGHTITARYVQKKAGATACCLLTGKTHTFLTGYHGIHTDKLVFISSFGRLFKFYISLYYRSIFLIFMFVLISHYSTNGRITLWKVHTVIKRRPASGAFERPGSLQTSDTLCHYSHRHCHTTSHLYSTCLCSHGYQNSTPSAMLVNPQHTPRHSFLSFSFSSENM